MIFRIENSLRMRRSISQAVLLFFFGNHYRNPLFFDFGKLVFNGIPVGNQGVKGAYIANFDKGAEAHLLVWHHQDFPAGIFDDDALEGG